LSFPLLEFDPTRKALIEPGKGLVPPAGVPERCVVCFFQEVLDSLLRENRLRVITNLRSEIGKHPVYQMDASGIPVAIIHPGVGAPLAAALLEEVISLGCRKFIACGSAGVLHSGIILGHVIVPTSAVRDEGTSYHYLPPSREVTASPEAVAAIERALARHQVEYTIGKTWTTDAIYRETPSRIAARRTEGCLTVEMETAAFFAVAKFRGVIFGQMLYGGDDLGGSEWDSRGYTKATTAREKLFQLAIDAVTEL
jgi:uridine phosphorylase